MNDFLIGLCSYLSLTTPNQNAACHTVVTQGYMSTPVYQQEIIERHYVEKLGTSLYSYVPYNQPIGLIAGIAYEIHQGKYQIPVANFLKLGYDGCSYSLDFKLNW